MTIFLDNIFAIEVECVAAEVLFLYKFLLGNTLDTTATEKKLI